ncbi:hypothetical protein GJAV_G00265290 [Gymnothorax javanicus]|nr:hypothetical protein GJAV_G00265290 [Gymnothorax javanicus]
MFQYDEGRRSHVAAMGCNTPPPLRLLLSHRHPLFAIITKVPNPQRRIRPALHLGSQREPPDPDHLHPPLGARKIRCVFRSQFSMGMTVNTASAVIPRREIRMEHPMSVWVVTRNGLDSERSEKYTFHTGDIKRPPAPVITDHIAHSTDLEILWDFKCPPARSPITMFDITCKAQYCREDQDSWTEGEEVAQDRHLLEGIQAFSKYVFRVRCACPRNHQLFSEWSGNYTAQTTEAAPIGFLDVWIDSRKMDQAVVWKELPAPMAGGRVLGYLVAVERAGGSRTVLNVSAQELGVRESGSTGLKPCCRHPLSLQGVTAVAVSAYNSQGKTNFTRLVLPMTENPAPGLLSVSSVIGKGEFNVSWDPPSHLTQTIREYIVQQEEVGLNFARDLDWIWTNKTQRNIILKGDFRNYTAYNLSLFGVINGRGCLLDSVIAYMLQGVPPAVPKIQVSQISSSGVTLSWEHIPLSQRRGVIQRYRLGQGNHTGTEPNTPKHPTSVPGTCTSLQIFGLQPSQTYQFWIAAVSEAGVGPKQFVIFSTLNHTGDHFFTLLVLPALFGLFFIFLLYSHWKALYSVFPLWCHEKVPDVTNSKLLLQIQTPISTWPSCKMESDPELCLLELVEALPLEREPGDGERERTEELEEEGEGGGSMKELVGRKSEECYKQERSNAIEEGSQFYSDYEKHFMPSPVEVLCGAS